MTSLQNLFVAKLPRNLTDSDLERIFAAYNPTSAKIMLDATTGKSKGFGFVLFSSEDQGRAAYVALNKTHISIHGHSFNLCIFPSKHDGKVAAEPNNALYIRNIPRSLPQAEVEKFLQGFGVLTYCAMREDHYGSPVWVVYAEYDSVESAQHALTNLHGNRSYFNYPVAVLAKFADSEEAKKERRRRRERMAPPPNPYQMGMLAPPVVQPPPPPDLHAAPHMPVPAMAAVPFGHAPYIFHQHFAPARGTVAPAALVQPSLSPPPPPLFQPPPPPLPPAPPAVESPTQPPPLALQSLQAPPTPRAATPTSAPAPATASGPAPPSPRPLSSPFLNVTFQAVAASHSGHSYGRLSPLCSGSNGRCTPLSLSFGTDNTTEANAPPAVSSNNGPTTPLTPSTPKTQRSLSASGTYRHNPYAPVTPVSSATSSAGPSSPVTKTIASSTSAHFISATPHHRIANAGAGGSGDYKSSHFASNGSNGFLAASSVNGFQ